MFLTGIYESIASSIEDFERLLVRIKRVIDVTLELNFTSMMTKSLYRRVFERKPYSVKTRLFRLKNVITPDRVRVKWGEYSLQATVATNPSITGSYKNALLYLKTSIYPGTENETFISRATIDLGEPLYELSVEPYIPRIIPRETIGDPKADPVDPSIVYHSRRYCFWNKEYTIPFKAFLDRFEGLKVAPILFSYRGEPRLYSDVREVSPLNPKYMVFTPYMRKRKTSAVFIGPVEDGYIDLKNASVVPELIPRHWEVLTGFGSSVRIGRGENLLFYYSEDPFGIRRFYVAVLSDTGEFLGGTPDPVFTPDTYASIGSRSSLVMVSGAIVEKNRVVVTAGLGETAFAIYEADLDKILDSVVYRK